METSALISIEKSELEPDKARFFEKAVPFIIAKRSIQDFGKVPLNLNVSLRGYFDANWRHLTQHTINQCTTSSRRPQYPSIQASLTLNPKQPSQTPKTYNPLSQHLQRAPRTAATLICNRERSHEKEGRLYASSFGNREACRGIISGLEESRI